MQPMFDPSKLKDDELLSRIGQANAYLYMQTQLGHDSAVDSIKDTIAILENERKHRMQLQITTEQLKKYPNALNPVTLGEIDATPKPIFHDDEERKRVSKIRRRRI